MSGLDFTTSLTLEELLKLTKVLLLFGLSCCVIDISPQLALKFVFVIQCLFLNLIVCYSMLGCFAAMAHILVFIDHYGSRFRL